MKSRVPRALAAVLAAGAVSSARAGAPAGETEIRLQSGGIERTCLIHVPTPAPKGPMPLLLALHGGGGTAEGMVRLTESRFDRLADRDGVLVAYPQGVGRSWNDGRSDTPSRARRQKVDDVAFFRDLIGELSRLYPVDRARVFAAGMSNGGMMALRLGCSLGDEIAGVAAVGASLPEDVVPLCPETTKVSLVLIDGTADPIVPYGGGEVRVLWRGRGEVIGAERTFKLWSQAAGCRGPAKETRLPDKSADGTHVTKIEASGCASTSVVLYRVEGGGHAWPGGEPYLGERLIGKTSANLSACDAIWEDFRR
jgi:polyhydroxybutyrate depolymerase